MRSACARLPVSDPARKLLQVCELQTYLAAALAKPVIAGQGGSFGSWPNWVVTSIQQIRRSLPASG